MFRPLPLFIGLRYTRAKRRNHFISFISLASMLGIALGVAVLITVLSVMNGFDYEIRSKIFSMARQVTVTGVTGSVSDWQVLRQYIIKQDHVVAGAPFVTGQGMLSHDGQSHGIIVTGILPDQEAHVSNMELSMVEGSIQALKPGEFGIILGDTMAGILGLTIGDKVTLVTPQTSLTPMGVLPRFKRFTVVGLFHVGGGFGFDDGVGFVNMSDAQKVFNLGKSVSGVRLKVDNLYSAPRVSQALGNKLPPQYMVSDWTEEFGAFFKAVRMEKTMMFIILLLIISVATFNLVSTLVMVVTDKRAEIAILRTLGAHPRFIMATFMVQGCIIGVIGTLLGLIGGVLLAINAPRIVSGIQDLFGVQFISSSVYFIDYLPSKLEWPDVWHICLAALIMSLIATIYPALQAARTQPAEALRYE